MDTPYKILFKMNQKQELETIYKKVYGTKNSKRINMLMEIFIELQPENFQLKKTVMNLQNNMIT